jgi:hypothetical protein
MKQHFLNGRLNVAQCPSCGAITQVATPILYHDPDHELFMVHVPMEMSLPHSEQEKLIGQLVKRAMDSLPPEKRRGYMFQPQTVLSMQTFVEKILETEGVTPEMMARQRQQAQLLKDLVLADKETISRLLQERSDEFDEVFFGMLRSNLEAAERSGQEDIQLRLVNLQARLYRETEFGRQLMNQQKALHAFSREAKKQGLSPDLLLKHVLEHRDDDMVVDALIMGGQQAFNYEFFAKLTEKIEKRQKAGASVEQYLALRERLLEIQQALEQRSRQIIGGAQATLQAILQADDRAAAVYENIEDIDDAFMYVLANTIALAEQQKKHTQVAALQEVQALIMQLLEQQLPPEIKLINELLEAENEAEQRNLLRERKELIGPPLLQMVQAIRADAQETDEELDSRLGPIESMIQTQLLMA